MPSKNNDSNAFQNGNGNGASVFDLEVLRLVSEHDADIRALNNRLGGIEHSIDEIKNFLQGSNRTNWAALASWAAVLLAIAMGWSSGFLRDLYRVEEYALANQQKHVEQAYKNGFSDARMEDLEDQVKMLLDELHKDKF